MVPVVFALGKKGDLNATVKRILTCHPQDSARGPLKKQVNVLCLDFAHLLYSALISV
jgi:hypothetical protein